MTNIFNIKMDSLTLLSGSHDLNNIIVRKTKD